MKRGGLDNIKAASVWCPERCDKWLNDRGSRGARGRERELKVKALGDRQWDEDNAAGEFCLDYSPPNFGVPENVCKLPWQNGSWSSWIECSKQSILFSPESYISFVCRTTSQTMPSHPECTQFLSKENSFFFAPCRLSCLWVSVSQTLGTESSASSSILGIMLLRLGTKSTAWDCFPKDVIVHKREKAGHTYENGEDLLIGVPSEATVLGVSPSH